jgi:Toprim-like
VAGQGNALINAAQRHLWSAVGQEALAYLHTRGLHDDIIRRFRLGYWPTWTECRLADWGLEGEKSSDRDKTFWIRPGMLFPSTEKDVLWGIIERVTAYSKRERQEMAQGKQPSRYKQIRGSGNGLFNVDTIAAGKPLFMTEGIIDALSIVQETPYSAVAAGSTSGAQLTLWHGKLSLASPLLLAFDHDDGKGEKAATYWTEIVFPGHARYWQPWGKDVNEMLQSGHDLALWAAQAITTLPLGFTSLPPDNLLMTSALESESASEPAPEHIAQGHAPIVPNLSPTSAPATPAIPIASVDSATTTDTAKHDDIVDLEGIYDIPTVQEIGWVFGKMGAMDPPTYTFAYYVQAPRHHQPTTLPPLPREKCLHYVTVQGEKGFIKRWICNMPTLAHGWCERWHAGSAALLELGASLGYPTLKVSAYRAIDAGIEQWELYAQTTIVGVREMRVLLQSLSR